ncbi:MAG TPA: hypothetical protein VGV37_22470 [Aliidongia sp.]|uniref:hypothetical protein n=1 Tax=Aliidongia sp. TaxID=1914230 RepID=UPI002DDD2955|nr:hypothetical protein [Aliidongia sp.]HEV2677310.1 hypothetical protein [Aliidongia sp.]
MTLEEQHATGQKTILRDVPEVYFLDGAGVTLPSLKPIFEKPVDDRPSILRAPVLPKPGHPGEIVALQLRNDTPLDLPSRVVTFGQVFVPGDFPGGTVLEAMVGNDAIPVQADIKVRYPDKSVKHAVISLQAPALAPAASAIVMLSARPGSASTSPITPKTILSSGYDLTLVRDFPSQGGLPPLSVDARSVLSSGVADGSVTVWLSGPLATEYRVTQRLVPNQLVTFDIRATADGAVRTDMSISNDFAYLFPQTTFYDATVTQSGMSRWKSPALTHRRFQEWHKVFWNREAAVPSIVFDVDYLERSGAVPNYDLSSGLARSVLERTQAAMAKADTGPLGGALITKQMATPGGRDDIGPTTNWAANYLASQDSGARAVMLAQADAAGSIPWHVREITGQWTTAMNRPQLWLDARCRGVDCLPGGFAGTGAVEWVPEPAHEPDLSYIPYLTTGSHFYLDQLQSEANWLVMSEDPESRQNDKGLFYPASPVSGIAWNLRDIANAAWITPDDDVLKPYFETVAGNNLDGLQQAYLVQRVMRQSGAIEGFVRNPADLATIIPRQQDFLALAMTQQALRGSEAAKRFAGWSSNFVAGRFLHDNDGYNPLHGPVDHLAYVDPQNKAPTNAWAELYKLNFPAKPAPLLLDGNPAGAGGDAAIARAAAANLFSATQDPHALRAFAFIAGNAAQMVQDFPNGNAFNINPRFPDGHLLQNDEIQYASASGTRVVAKATHSLLVGGAAHTTLQGIKGVSILVGGSGATTLIGAPGINYFFAGSGESAMDGAAGQNYFGMGIGKAQIDLAATDVAVDRIEGFRPGKDHIHLIGLDTELAKVIANAHRAAEGLTILTIGPAHTIELIGMPPSDVTSAYFN